MMFWTSLIVVRKKQTLEAAKSLKVNCTYVDNKCWIFEGETWALEEDGVIFKVVGEGAVPALGDMSKKELVELCKGIYGIDVYKQSY